MKTKVLKYIITDNAIRVNRLNIPKGIRRFLTITLKSNEIFKQQAIHIALGYIAEKLF